LEAVSHGKASAREKDISRTHHSLTMQKRVILAIGDMVADILLPPLGALPDRDSQLLLDHVKLSPGGNTLNFALSAAAQEPLSSSTAPAGTMLSGRC